MQANSGFCRLADSGDWGSSKSGLRRLSIGSVSAESRFCRGEGNVARILFSKHLFVGTLLNLCSLGRIGARGKQQTEYD